MSPEPGTAARPRGLRSPAAGRALAAASCLALAAACGPGPDAAGSSDGAGEAARGGAAGASTAAPDSARRAAVVAAARGFREALARGDSAGALARLHPEAVIHEGGHAETRAEYRSGHLAADMEFLGAMAVETTREEVVLGRDQALYLSEYRMSGSMGGDALRLRGVETMVLAPSDGGWRIRHVHWSSREAGGG